MFNIKEITTIIFDLDGTIIDTETLYNLAWREALSFYGYTLSYNEALKLRSLDSNLAKKYLHSLFGQELDYQKIREKRKELMTKSIIDNNGIKQKPNIMNVLNLLKEKKLKTVICSASSPETIHNNLELANINFNFDAIISAKSVNRGKPYPDVYLYACDYLSEEPSKTLVIEDAPNGLISAKRACCNTIMIPDLSFPKKSLHRYIDIVLDDLYVFEEYIRKNFF